jgi:hypothetical protein
MRRGDQTAFGRFRVAGVGARKPAPVGSVLQPILHDPIAAWALLDEDAGGSPTMVAPINADRVSGAYPLTRTPGTVLASPDLIKAHRAPYGGASARPLGRESAYGAGVESALKLPGELTISMRAWWSGQTTSPYPVLVDVSEAYAARNIGAGGCQCFYRLYIMASDGGIGGYHQETNGSSYTDRTWTSSLKLTPGRWTYVALRRSAAGAYTVTRDADHDTGPALGSLPNPAYGVGALNLGQWGSVQLDASTIYPGVDAWMGGYADVMVWGKRLSDAQIDHQREVMFAIEAAP